MGCSLASGQFAKSFGRALGSDVALRTSQHLESDHKLSDRCRPQQWRIEVRVEVPLRVIRPIRWRLVKSHRVREGNTENFVVRGSDSLQHRGQRASLFRGELCHISEMASAAYQSLEGPYCPEGHQRNEAFVGVRQAHLLSFLQCNIVTQKAAAVGFLISMLRNQLFFWRFWNRCRRPNLAVGVGIAGAHHGAAILENLYVSDIFQVAEFAELFDPGAHYNFNSVDTHGGQCEIVPRRKAD